MSEKRKTIVCNTLIAVLAIFCVLISVHLGMCRNIYHIDEIWSYALGSSTSGKYWFDWCNDDNFPQEHVLDVDQFFDHWHNGSFFKNYISVQKGEEFRYDIAYNYQSTDLSPPLYYAVLHTVCSFFPDKFSKWFGLIPNIVFFVLCILILYFIAGKMFKNKQQALTATVLWALSRAAFSDVILIRMYMLATLLTILSFALHLEILKERKKTPFFLLAAIFLVNIAGFLTHNYLYVYTFFLALGVCLILIFKRKIKQMLVFGFTELFSVGTAILIFPAVIKQMTSSSNGQSAVHSVFIGYSADERGFMCILLNNIFGISDTIAIPIQNVVLYTIEWIIVVSLLILFIDYLILKKKLKLDEKSTSKYEKSRNKVMQKYNSKLKPIMIKPETQTILLLFFTFALTGRVVELASPTMTIFQDRYFFNILPLAFLGAAWFFFTVIEFFFRKRKKKHVIMIATELLLVLLVIAGNFTSKNNFLFYEKDQSDLQYMLNNQTCFIIVSVDRPDYRVHNYSAYLQNTKKAYFTKDVNQKLIDNIAKSPNLYLFINNDMAGPDSVVKKVAGNHQARYIGNYNLSENNYNIYYLE